MDLLVFPELICERNHKSENSIKQLKIQSKVSSPINQRHKVTTNKNNTQHLFGSLLGVW
jgi:hypothetical protein